MCVAFRATSTRARRLGYGGGPRRNIRRGRPAFLYAEDDILDMDDNWEALNVSFAYALIFPPSLTSTAEIPEGNDFSIHLFSQLHHQPESLKAL